MRCLNMKIGDVLFFIVNFIAIYSMKSPQDKTLQTTTLVNEENLENNFAKACPQLSKIIRENNLTDYTLNCKPLITKNFRVNEENVLKYACLIVKSIVSFMCENKLNMTSDFLKRENASSFCPFNFSHLEKLGFRFNNYVLIKELQKSDHCSQVCSDLDATKLQCVVLSNFNNYLKHFVQTQLQKNLTTVKEGKPSAELEHPEPIKQNTENGVASTLEDKEHETRKNDTKETTKKEKIETTDAKFIDTKNSVNDLIIKEKETEKPVSLTPINEQKLGKKVEVPESETKISEEENLTVKNNDLKQKNEDLNEEDEPNEEDLSSIGEINPVKTDFGRVPDLPKVESSEVILDSSLKGKEIYSGEGFFQAEDSHFFFYFIMVSSVIVVGYLAFHNKNKILAYALEGTNGRRSRRRPNPARYRKLETNLEEVISSNTTNATSSSIVY